MSEKPIGLEEVARVYLDRTSGTRISDVDWTTLKRVPNPRYREVIAAAADLIRTLADARAAAKACPDCGAAPDHPHGEFCHGEPGEPESQAEWAERMQRLAAGDASEPAIPEGATPILDPASGKAIGYSYSQPVEWATPATAMGEVEDDPDLSVVRPDECAHVHSDADTSGVYRCVSCGEITQRSCPVCHTPGGDEHAPGCRRCITCLEFGRVGVTSSPCPDCGGRGRVMAPKPYGFA